MARSKKASAAPTPEAREKLFLAVSQVKEPTEAAKLVKLVEPPDRVTEKIALPWLEEAVVAGTLFVSPPKTAKGKPRYWDRSLEQVARVAVLESLPSSSAPFTVKELLKQLKSPVKFTEADLQPILKDLQEQKLLFPIPPATQKGGPRLWTRPAEEFGRQTLLVLLESKGPQPEASLKKGVKGFSQEQVEQIWKQAIADRVVYRHPPVGKSKKEVFGKSPPSASAYFNEIGTQFSKVVKMLLEANVSDSDLRRAFIEVGERAGIRFGSSSEQASGTSNPVGSPPSSRVDLISVMRKLEPAADRGALIGLGALRRASGLSKNEFDAAVLDLARKQRCVLHRHDFPSSLSEQSRDELVFDGRETYFVGIALRNDG